MSGHNPNHPQPSSILKASPVPTSRALHAILDVMPKAPSPRAMSLERFLDAWTQYEDAMRDWSEALREAASHATATSDDATQLMCEVFDGKRDLDNARNVAAIIAIRA